MTYNETKVSNGYLSNNPDFDVANDTISNRKYQAIKLIDATEGSTAPIGVAANPLPIQGTVSLAGIADAATEATLSTINSKITSCNTGAVNVSSSALPTGASTEATLSALNGKVIACNTGAVVVSSSALPAGAATSANQITINNNLSRPSGSSVTQKSVTTSNTSLLASNPNRKGFIIAHDLSSGAAVRVKLGAAASASSYSVYINVGDPPFIAGFGCYTGPIDAITDSGTATLQVTEIT